MVEKVCISRKICLITIVDGYSFSKCSFISIADNVKFQAREKNRNASENVAFVVEECEPIMMDDAIFLEQMPIQFMEDVSSTLLHEQSERFD